MLVSQSAVLALHIQARRNAHLWSWLQAMELNFTWFSVSGISVNLLVSVSSSRNLTWKNSFVA